MKVAVTKASDYDYIEYKEMNSLEELREFISENGDVIVRDNQDNMQYEDAVLEILIYDDYLE